MSEREREREEKKDIASVRERKRERKRGRERLTEKLRYTSEFLLRRAFKILRAQYCFLFPFI